jgi:hypothetical protein
MDDVTATCVFRSEALRAVPWAMDPQPGPLPTSALVLAALLDGWLGATIPDVLSLQRSVSSPLHDGLTAAAHTRLLPSLKQRFPAQVSADAVELLTLLHRGSNPRVADAEESQRRIAELEHALHAQERLVSEQATWIDKLVEAKDWLDDQRLRWERIASERGAELERLRLSSLADRARRADEAP